jgi:hypothetical protein
MNTERRRQPSMKRRSSTSAAASSQTAVVMTLNGRVIETGMPTRLNCQPPARAAASATAAVMTPRTTSVARSLRRLPPVAFRQARTPPRIVSPRMITPG